MRGYAAVAPESCHAGSRRAERRQQGQAGTKFWLSPANTDAWLTGHRASPF